VSTVEEGQTLLRIHASSQKALKEAVAKLNKMSSIVRKWSEASW
jgi:thymidine phosphorylase